MGSTPDIDVITGDGGHLRVHQHGARVHVTAYDPVGNKLVIIGLTPERGEQLVERATVATAGARGARQIERAAVLDLITADEPDPTFRARLRARLADAIDRGLIDPQPTADLAAQQRGDDWWADRNPQPL